MLNRVKRVQLEIPSLASSSAWDKRLNTTDDLQTTLEILEARLDSPLHARRYLQATLATGDLQRIEAAQAQVAEYGHAGLEGICCKILVQQGRYEAALNAPRAQPILCDEWHVENMLDDEMAQATARAELGDLETAQRHLYAAQLLAQILKMPYQLQWCMLERGRLGIAQGSPNSELVREALSMMAASDRRQQWGSAMLATSLLGEGDGEGAWAIAQHLDPYQSEGIAVFLAYYLGHEISEYQLNLPGAYAELTRALLSPDRARLLAAMPVPQAQPLRSIVRSLQIAELAASTHSRQYALQMAEQVLQEATPSAQHVFMLALVAEIEMSLQSTRLSARLRQFAEGLASLKAQAYVSTILRTQTPRTMALLAVSPYAKPTFPRLEHLPVVVGSTLVVNDTTYSLPGRSQGGVQLVRQGFFGPQVKLHHAARSRIMAAAEAIGHHRVVNLGELLRQVVTLAASDPDHREHWQGMARLLLERVDSRPLRQEIAASDIYAQTINM